MAKDLSQKYSAFPSDFESLERKKTPEYGLDYVKAIYSNWIINYPPTNPQLLRYVNNRQFAEGTYNTDIYKARFGLTGDASYLNLDMTAIGRIPTIIDNMIGKMMNKAWRFSCNPLDTVAKSKYDKKRAEVKADMFLKKQSAEMEQMTGMPLVPKGKYVPEDDEEFEIHMQMDFKLDEAMAMEEALKWVFDNNEFNTHSLPDIYKDLFVDKKCAIFRYYDENKNIKVKRWDHLQLLHPYSNYSDFRDVPYQALLQSYNIGIIAKMNPGFTDEQLWTIARSAAGSNNNTPWNSDWGLRYVDYYNAYGASAYRQFQNFNINVVNFYFLSPVQTTKAVIKSQNGRIKVDEKKEGYKSDKGVETINKRKLVRFEGYWIPNTDYIWGYKMSENMDRDVVNCAYSPETELPCKIIMPNKIGNSNKSMVERMIPFEKQLCLAWYKLQQFLINAQPPGLAIDQNALLEVVNGAGEGKPLPTDWTRLYKQTGNIIFSSRDADGNIINKPFEELQGGISQAFQQFLVVMDYCKSSMNDVVGYNPAVDGSAPKPDALVGVNQQAINATYDALRPLYLEAVKLIEGTGKRVALMIQDCLRHGNEDFKDALINAIGEANVDVLIEGRDMPLPSAAISIEIQPEDNEMMEINQQLQIAQSIGALNASDIFRVRQQLKTNIKLAAQLLVYLEKKNAKQKQKDALEMSQQNGQVQVQSAQAAAQSQAQLDEILTQNKIKVVMAQGEEERKNVQLKGEYSLQETAMKVQGSTEVAYVNKDRAIEQQHVANYGKSVVEDQAHHSKIRQISLENALAPKETAKD